MEAPAAPLSLGRLALEAHRAIDERRSEVEKHALI
jgi:hypothetical protein